MNRLFAAIIIVGIAAFAVAAGDPTGEAVDATYWLEPCPDFTALDGSTNDSLVGDDSIIVESAYSPKPGFQYIMVNNALTENAEAEFVLVVRCLDEDGDVLYSVTVDTLADDGGAIMMPFFETLIGNKYKIIIEDGAADASASGTPTVLNTLKMYRRRLITNDQARWR